MTGVVNASSETAAGVEDARAGPHPSRRVVIHDYTGHPFQVQLSRALAARGHRVLHLYSGSFQTPHGRLVVGGDDAATLEIEAVRLRANVDKRSLLRRSWQEAAYGRVLLERVRAFDPEVIVSANTPLGPQAALLRWSRRRGRRMVYWLQDLYGVAVRRILRRRVPLLGDLIGAFYQQWERRLVAASDRVVLISEDFVAALGHPATDERRAVVIENWAPLDEMPMRPKRNAWSEAQGLANRRLVMYAGTLGMKHDPGMLLALAEHVRGIPDVSIVVVSEGPGADWLQAQARERGLPNLTILPFQPFEVMPDVLGASELLVVLLEPEAGRFSVPSKVLTYLCAGRPIVAAMPAANLGARTLSLAGAGELVDPRDSDRFVHAVETILANTPYAHRLGRAGRAYAERTFDIVRIADQFESVLFSSTPSRLGTRDNN